MKLRTTTYSKRYLPSCSKLVRDTWNFHSQFQGIKNIDLVYTLYFLNCENYSEHTELLIDENDEVKGLLFGSIENESFLQAIKYKCKTIKMAIWAMYHYLRGNFGDRSIARREFANFIETDNAGEAFAHEFDSEINLFIVSEELRGRGYGTMLMDSYVEFCRKNNLRTAFLWTDLDCTYSFYEKYGFALYSRFLHDSLSTKRKDNANGLIFYLTINTKKE